ncbi:SDR family NAD(P)-dependent oxidoreductase [Streptomyces acidicola]|uniref:SDR family NAD(P)-dependent oxidoreductase n=1 Tax=Streptomyces acidicola TaxID=2596892 RepID=UPI00343A1FF1
MSQVWLITGASRGLGRAIAIAALEAGHSVAATTRSGVLDDVDPRFSDRLLVLPLDVTAPDEQVYSSVVESVTERFGRIDVLVNNAGHGILVCFEETDDAQVRELFETNVFGLMRVTRAVLPVMRQQRSGHIFNLSSLAGYVGGNAMYSATKFAVTGFTESLAFELSPFGIKATNVGPGYFRTDFLDSSSITDRPANELADYKASREQIRSFAEQANHQQAGDPAALGRLLVEVAASEHPPVHLPVGADCIEAVEQHQSSLASDVDAWRDKSVATAHETA